MNEMQRMRYLDAMGIDSYMPRRVLPNAPPARLCAPVALRVVSASDAVDTGRQRAAPALAPRAATGSPSAAKDVMALLQERLASSKPANPGAAKSAAVNANAEESAAIESLASPPATGAAGRSPTNLSPSTQVPSAAPATPAMTHPAGSGIADPRFALSIWTISNELLVIDSRHPELALPTESLLGNILFALGYVDFRLPRAEIFKWPMHEQIVEARDESAAREALDAMLASKLEMLATGMLASNLEKPRQYCLLLGEEACYYTLPAELCSNSEDGVARPAAVFSTMAGKAVALPALGVTAIVAPALSQMLQNPDLKGLAWRAVQPLRLSR